MHKRAAPDSLDRAENRKITLIILAAAALGAGSAFISAGLFGYEATLAVIVVTFFMGLSFSSTVIEAIIATIVLAIPGYMGLNYYPRLLFMGGALSGLALAMAVAALKEKVED